VGALRVLSQDLDSISDAISLGDKKGNNASINPLTSALFVEIKNPVSAVQILNPVTSLSAYVLNPVKAVSIIPTNPSIIRTFNNFNNGGAFSVGGTEVPVLAVRIKPNSGSTGYIEDYELLASAAGGQNTTILGYTWYYQPTAIGGSYTWNTLVNSNLQYTQLNSNTFSGGIPVHSGAIVSANASNESDIGFISLSGSPTPDVFLLSMKRLDSSSSTTFWYAVDFAQD
jgi:hypothetical protein